MATVRKREWTYQGKHQSAWIVDYKDQNKKRRLKTFNTKREADSFLIQTQHELRHGIHTPDSECITVREAAQNWLDACRRGRDGRDPVEASTMRQYDQHVRLHITPNVGEKKLNELSAPVVATFRDNLLDKHSRALAKKIFTSFKSILTEAQGRGLLAKNPAAGVKIRSSDRYKEEVAIPRREHIKTILEKLDELATQCNKQYSKRWRRWRALINTATFTGMRASELRGLSWKNVNLADGMVLVRERADENGTIGRVKSSSGVRDIPISRQLVQLLREWKLEAPPGDLVFPNWKGNTESLPNIFNRAWSPLLERCELAHFNFHTLRHFHASRLIASGANPKEVQVEMGHSSIKVTYDIYGKLFPEDMVSRQIRAQLMADEF